MARGESMKCIAVVDSDHSLMNFKLFGERRGAYRVDIDDATAKEKGYYTMTKQSTAESLFEWLLSEYRPLPSEAATEIIEKVLRNEDKAFPFLEEFMFYNSISSLPYFQQLDGRILSYYPKKDEKLWLVIDGELEIIYGDELQSICSLVVEKFGKFVPFALITTKNYNSTAQEWEEWESPIVYKFQPPVPLLIKRYDFTQDAPWPLESAKTEYGYPIDHHWFIITTGEIIESSESYTASTTAEVIREWDRWMK